MLDSNTIVEQQDHEKSKPTTLCTTMPLLSEADSQPRLDSTLIMSQMSSSSAPSANSTTKSSNEPNPIAPEYNLPPLSPHISTNPCTNNNTNTSSSSSYHSSTSNPSIVTTPPRDEVTSPPQSTVNSSARKDKQSVVTGLVTVETTHPNQSNQSLTMNSSPPSHLNVSTTHWNPRINFTPSSRSSTASTFTHSMPSTRTSQNLWSYHDKRRPDYNDHHSHDRKRPKTLLLDSHGRWTIITHHAKLFAFDRGSCKKLHETMTKVVWDSLQSALPQWHPATTLVDHITSRAFHFFVYCHERQSIWQRRHERSRKPDSNNNNNNTDRITKDAFLSRLRFCNVFRELDAGTIYLHRSIGVLWTASQKRMLKHKDDYKWLNQRFHQVGNYSSSGSTNNRLSPSNDSIYIKEALWSCICYRLINKAETFERLGGIPQSDQWRAFQAKLWKLKSYRENIIFTAAHQVIGFSSYISVMTALLKPCPRYPNSPTLLEGLAKFVEENRQTPGGISLIFDELTQVPYIGKFYAWQLSCDLLESGVLFSYTFGDFCVLGPGALNGLRIIFGNSQLQNHPEHVWIKCLAQMQVPAYQVLEEPFPKFGNRSMSLISIEHSLCEFFKYCKMFDHAHKARQVCIKNYVFLI